MISSAKWIWLDNSIYPGSEKSAVSFFDKENTDYEYFVAEFLKEATYEKEIRSIDIEVSGDVRFNLYVNESFVGLGPVCAGGDFGNKKPMPYTYYNSYCVDINSKNLRLYACVQNKPTVQCDMSRGRCGFILSCRVYFADGTESLILTDESWLARKNKSRISNINTNFTEENIMWSRAACVENPVWSLKKSQISNLDFEEIVPPSFSPKTVNPGEEMEFSFELDRIYSGYYEIKLTAADDYIIEIHDYERFPAKSANPTETITGCKSTVFRSMEMKSMGGFSVKVRNLGKSLLSVDGISVVFSHYPIVGEGDFLCSDNVFNDIYNMGKHALKICRQTIELDSPRHQENLGCVGDYHIASLMNYFAYGDASLTRFDIVRIADYLTLTDGYMFHTTFSMIWVMMLYKYYEFTADKEIFSEAKDALISVLERFSGYVGGRGVIDSPPNYMFVDWLIVDNYSMHHPPMCLGQSVLNAFYYGGLKYAEKIFSILEDKEYEKSCFRRAEKLRVAFNGCFYDKERGLYFDGLNDEYVPNKWMPENSEKRYFSIHTNSLAILFGITEKEYAPVLMEKILNDDTLIQPQPYFMHFVLEAIQKVGLFEKYGLKELRKWEVMLNFKKGLQEGWYDCNGYGFDYSHVWAGTPTYQLPVRISGFEMMKPGFRKVSLKPNLYDLEYADIKIPSSYGDITIHLKKGEKTIVSCEGKMQIVQENDGEYILSPDTPE